MKHVAPKNATLFTIMLDAYNAPALGTLPIDFLCYVGELYQ